MAHEAALTKTKLGFAKWVADNPEKKRWVLVDGSDKPQRQLPVAKKQQKRRLDSAKDITEDQEKGWYVKWDGEDTRIVLADEIVYLMANGLKEKWLSTTKLCNEVHKNLATGATGVRMDDILKIYAIYGAERRRLGSSIKSLISLGHSVESQQTEDEDCCDGDSPSESTVPLKGET